MNNRQRKKLNSFPCTGCGKIHGERRIDRRRRQNIESTMRRINRRHPPIPTPFKFNLKINVKPFVKAMENIVDNLTKLALGYKISSKTYEELLRRNR